MVEHFERTCRSVVNEFSGVFLMMNYGWHLHENLLGQDVRSAPFRESSDCQSRLEAFFLIEDVLPNTEFLCSCPRFAS